MTDTSFTPKLARLAVISENEEQNKALEYHKPNRVQHGNANPDSRITIFAPTSGPAQAQQDLGRDEDAIAPTSIRLSAPGSRAARRWGAFVGGVVGVVGGGAAGFVLGTPIPIIGNIVGAVGGAVAGGVMGATGTGLAGGAVGGPIYNRLRGGQGQQAHLDRALESPEAQGVTFTAQERERLLAISPREWRTYLNAPWHSFRGGDGLASGLTRAQQRQAFREAFVLTVAKQGKDAAVAFREDLGKMSRRKRGNAVLAHLDAAGGHSRLFKAFVSRNPQQAVEQERNRQHANRAAWSSLSQDLERRFGAETRTRLEETHARAIDRGDDLPQDLINHWSGVGKHPAAAADVLARIRTIFGDAGYQAAVQQAQAQYQALVACEATASATLSDFGRLGEGETEALYAAASKAQTEASALDAAVPAAPELAPLLDNEAARRRVETALFTDPANEAEPNGFPLGVFTGEQQSELFATCAILDDTSAQSLIDRSSSGDRTTDELREERVLQAKGLARLALALADAGIPENEAAELIRLELAERMAGQGADDYDQWSPALADPDNPRLPDQVAHGRARETMAFKLELRNSLDQDRAFKGIRQDFVDDTVDRMMLYGALHAGVALKPQGEFAAPPDDDAVSYPLLLLANDAAGLRAAIRASVDVAEVMDLMQRGAASVSEAISCARLGVEPESFAQIGSSRSLPSAAIVTQWTDAGFDRAEAITYAPRFRLGDNLLQFRRSHLSPDEMVMYLQWGLPFNELTAPGYFIDRNRLLDLGHADHGGINNVYRGFYKTPFGVEQRFFKPGEPERDADIMARPARLLGANLGMRAIDEALGFDVIVHSSIGISNGRVGLSMAKGGDFTVGHLGSQRSGVAASMMGENRIWIGVPRDGPLGDLYLELDTLRDDGDAGERRRQELCDLYGWDAIRVDHHGTIGISAPNKQLLRHDAAFQRKTVALQVVDYLGDLKDHHRDNYMVSTDEGPPKLRVTDVKGIDNDDAFGAIDLVSHFPGLPKVMDREQVEAIKYLREHREEFIPQLEMVVRSRSGSDQILQFRKRLLALFQYVSDPRRNGLTIIEPDQWGSEAVTNLLMRGNSMVARDT